ncbi:SemiSWEET family sugar transporter [Ensifer sp. SL37]|uniref:SemiSWEET family sugar transporter n=1 Tax=Ensifer sp. SL37 TaxID=2995137 RepID=UPI002272A1D5|nr:SemiSWEET transporter [Ensifer sp. SL37]MCY1746375.1 SemiSWEET transporter [Ensifer sp. SL37]
MEATLLIGYLASICSVDSFVPQAWKVVKTGDTSALSARMYVLTVTGFALWTVFGVLKGEWPIIIANAICFCLSAFIILRKLGGCERGNRRDDRKV